MSREPRGRLSSEPPLRPGRRQLRRCRSGPSPTAALAGKAYFQRPAPLKPRLGCDDEWRGTKGISEVTPVSTGMSVDQHSGEQQAFTERWPISSFRLGELLVRSGAVDPEALQTALRRQES